MKKLVSLPFSLYLGENSAENFVFKSGPENANKQKEAETVEMSQPAELPKEEQILQEMVKDGDPNAVEYAIDYYESELDAISTKDIDEAIGTADKLVQNLEAFMQRIGMSTELNGTKQKIKQSLEKYKSGLLKAKKEHQDRIDDISDESGEYAKNITFTGEKIIKFNKKGIARIDKSSYRRFNKQVNFEMKDDDVQSFATDNPDTEIGKKYSEWSDVRKKLKSLTNNL